MQIPGYEIDGPIGFGADGATWLARDSSGSAVAVRVLGPVPPARHQARLDRLEHLQAVDHPHLALLREVVPISADRIAVITEAVPGPTLATLRVGRGALRAAEVIGVGAQLASALVALHQAGLAHGDVAPANIVLNPGRGAVLVDLAGEPAWEAGTGGFTAPEVDAGAPATPASDVYALARLLLWLASPADQAALAQLLAPALQADAGARCDASQVQRALASRPQAPVGVPDLRKLAAVSLREHAQRDLTRRKGSTRPRHRRAPNRRPALLVALVVVLALGGASAWMWPGLLPVSHDGGPADGEGPGSSDRTDRPGAGAGDNVPQGPAGVAVGPIEGVAARPSTPDEPLAAVDLLTQARDRAVNDGDGQALLQLTVPGSPAAAHDSGLAADLHHGLVQVQGLRTEVLEAQMLSDGTVQVQLRAHEHTRSTERGTIRVPLQDTCVRLDLARHHRHGWQVQQVYTC